jgi:hypothetical protein
VTTTSNTTKTQSTKFAFTEISGGVVTSNSESISKTTTYSYGTGNFQVDVGVKLTGVLGSGLSQNFDLTNLTKSILGFSQTVSLTGVKEVSIINASTGLGFDFNVVASGGAGATQMFNGTGNYTIKPYGGFSYGDPWGSFQTINGSAFSLVDAGSGASYNIVILGTQS